MIINKEKFFLERILFFISIFVYTILISKNSLDKNFGDATYYYNTSIDIFRYVSGAKDDLVVIKRGWFMPGLSFLTAPSHIFSLILTNEYSLLISKIYLLIINLILLNYIINYFEKNGCNKLIKYLLFLSPNYCIFNTYFFAENIAAHFIIIFCINTWLLLRKFSHLYLYINFILIFILFFLRAYYIALFAVPVMVFIIKFFLYEFNFKQLILYSIKCTIIFILTFLVWHIPLQKKYEGAFILTSLHTGLKFKFNHEKENEYRLYLKKYYKNYNEEQKINRLISHAVVLQAIKNYSTIEDKTFIESSKYVHTNFTISKKKPFFKKYINAFRSLYLDTNKIKEIKKFSKTGFLQRGDSNKFFILIESVTWPLFFLLFSYFFLVNFSISNSQKYNLYFNLLIKYILMLVNIKFFYFAVGHGRYHVELIPIVVFLIYISIKKNNIKILEK